MTDIKLTLRELTAILVDMALDMKGHIDELRDLDAVIGDGDLGITVELFIQGATGYLTAPEETDIGKMLAKCGLNINKVNPSTFGTLLASAFMGAGKAVQGKTEITANDLELMANGAIAGIKQRGKAETGDKTMLDSLVPAVEAFRQRTGGEREPRRCAEVGGRRRGSRHAGDEKYESQARAGQLPPGRHHRRN